jgi:lipoprotein-anchoring transpeptidase ErfK/SrfK
MDKYKIAVHLKRRTMVVAVEDGKTKTSHVLKTIPRIIGGGLHIVHGKKIHFKTPTGKFKIGKLDRHYVSHKYHAAMPFSVFFTSGDAFHEGNVDSPSHGCVHLSRPDAEWLFNLMEVNKENTDVEISDD